MTSGSPTKAEKDVDVDVDVEGDCDWFGCGVNGPPNTSEKSKSGVALELGGVIVSFFRLVDNRE